MYTRKNPNNPNYYMVYAVIKTGKNKNDKYYFSKSNVTDKRWKSKKYVESIAIKLVEQERQRPHSSRKNYDETIFKDFIREFLLNKKSKDAKDTVKHFESRIRIYVLNYFNEDEYVSEIFVPKRMTNFVNYISSLHIKRALANKILSIMRLMADFAISNEYINSDKYYKCKLNLTNIKKTALSQLEERDKADQNKYTPYKDLKAALANDTTTSQVDKDALILLYFSGCRIGEFLGITIDNISIKNDCAFIEIEKQLNKYGYLDYQLKTEKSYRTIQYPKDITKILLEYMKLKYLTFEDKDRLFYFSRKTLERMLKNFLKKNGLENNTVHGFGRKSINIEMYLHGVDDKSRMDFLGQETVQINYKNYLDGSNSLNRVNKAMENILMEEKNDNKK